MPADGGEERGGGAGAERRDRADRGSYGIRGQVPESSDQPFRPFGRETASDTEDRANQDGEQEPDRVAEGKMDAAAGARPPVPEAVNYSLQIQGSVFSAAVRFRSSSRAFRLPASLIGNASTCPPDGFHDADSVRSSYGTTAWTGRCPAAPEGRRRIFPRCGASRESGAAVRRRRP